MKKTPLISIIIPAYNEAKNLEWHHGVIKDYMSKLGQAYEVVYVNDGSSDNSLEVIRELAKKHKQARYLSFSRNFGKEAATTAGLHAAKGDAAIMIDADGQHPIELIETFISEWKAGYATVIGVRENEGHSSLVKSLGSRIFYRILRSLNPNESTTHGLTDFRLVDRKIIDEYCRLTEHNRITRNLLDWLGYQRKLVPFQAKERHAGAASYSYKKLVGLAIDGIIKHSTRPLKLIGFLGGLISLISIVIFIFSIIEMYLLGDPLNLAITGSAILATFISFMVGIVLLCQGLLALYLESVYYETQNRPLYVIEEQS